MRFRDRGNRGSASPNALQDIELWIWQIHQGSRPNLSFEQQHHVELSLFSSPKEIKNKWIKLLEYPIGHMCKGRNIPNARQSQAMGNNGSVTIRQWAHSPRSQTFRNSIDTRIPVGSILITKANKNSKILYHITWPINYLAPAVL